MPCECPGLSMYAVQYAGLGQAVARYLPPQTRYLVPRGQDPAGGIMDPFRYLVAVVTDIWWLSWQISGWCSQISGLRQISGGPRPDIWCHGSMIPPAGCWTQPDIWSKPARYLVTAMYSRGGLPVAQLGLRFSTVPVQQPLHQACSGPSLHMGLRPRTSVSYCHWRTWASPHPLQRSFLWKLPVHN